MLREAASTDQRLLVAREAARSGDRDGVPDGDMEDDFEPVAGIAGTLQASQQDCLGAIGNEDAYSRTQRVRRRMQAPTSIRLMLVLDSSLSSFSKMISGPCRY